MMNSLSRSHRRIGRLGDEVNTTVLTTAWPYRLTKPYQQGYATHGLIAVESMRRRGCKERIQKRHRRKETPFTLPMQNNMYQYTKPCQTGYAANLLYVL